ncbi:MAG: four helix bundle protein [Planctomyces sp.]
MSINSYRDLEVWQKGMDLVVACYEAAKSFPADERFGLTTQLQRAAVSVPANIAEGHGRDHTKEFLNHLSIAYGSLMEVETHIQIAQRLEYVAECVAKEILLRTAELGRMLNGLQRSLKNRLNPPS